MTKTMIQDAQTPILYAMVHAAMRSAAGLLLSRTIAFFNCIRLHVMHSVLQRPCPNYNILLHAGIICRLIEALLCRHGPRPVDRRQQGPSRLQPQTLLQMLMATRPSGCLQHHSLSQQETLLPMLQTSTNTSM